MKKTYSGKFRSIYGPRLDQDSTKSDDEKLQLGEDVDLPENISVRLMHDRGEGESVESEWVLDVVSELLTVVNSLNHGNRTTRHTQ